MAVIRAGETRWSSIAWSRLERAVQIGRRPELREGGTARCAAFRRKAAASASASPMCAFGGAKIAFRPGANLATENRRKRLLRRAYGYSSRASAALSRRSADRWELAQGDPRLAGICQRGTAPCAERIGPPEEGPSWPSLPRVLPRRFARLGRCAVRKSASKIFEKQGQHSNDNKSTHGQ